MSRFRPQSPSARSARRIGLAASVIAVAALAAPTAGVAAPSAMGLVHSADVCGATPVGSARCHAKVVVNGKGGTLAATEPLAGSLRPADLQSAYKTTGLTAPAGQLVAIVDAYDHPYAQNDLNVYRAKFNLPPCTGADGCFRKVDQNGGTNYPRANGGWAQEISLDMDMVSAICPSCKILLVEAKTNQFSDLATAVRRAVTMGATVVSNSYGGSEWSGETSMDGAFNQGNVRMTVSSGDAGYRAEYPAASQYVTAVGGTSLTRTATTRGWSERVWSGAGSGCSAFEPRPSWQPAGACGSKRTIADVSAVADPATGVAVYDSFKYQGASGWMQFGGTSASAPLVGGMYALAGGGGGLNYSYTHAGSFWDVVTGSNGSCGGSYLCTGVTGYDGPSGLGTPNGVGGL
jgi:subtilase family serine protease